ncbi:MAG TPA: DNA repair protein RadC [Pseudomonadota bacterium]|nr:DNA repair protein RadC [Pseudomonadota bacterium]
MTRTEFLARPEASRPRERLMFLGAEQLTDDELLALILGSGAAQPLARRLLDVTGGPQGLLRAGQTALCSLSGVGPARACQIKAALELGRRALAKEQLLGLQVRAPSDIASVLSVELGLAEQEAVHVFGLDARHRIRCRHVAAVGQIDRVLVSPSDVFRPLVREGMAAVIVAHNHPSGIPSPSDEDQLLTDRLCQTGNLLGIPLLDHVIVAKSGYFSFADHGLVRSPLTPLAAPTALAPKATKATRCTEEVPYLDADGLSPPYDLEPETPTFTNAIAQNLSTPDLHTSVKDETDGKEC